MIEALCVFCGANYGRRPAYREAAQGVGELLARRGITLVYGGGNVGLMGTLAEACLGGGGRVIGVIPLALAEKEIAHTGLTEMHVVGSMHERKALMADLADAFLTLPGGFGTWDEFCEALTWSQLGLQKKACAFLNVEGYYDALLSLTERAAEDGFIRPEHRELLLVDTHAERLLERLQNYEVPYVPKWVDRAER
ncbi:MAG: TIGR00730 family Rossman fold protein [Terriglobales bacterium]